MTAYSLNLLDLLFTLHALSHGAAELNPFMQSVPVMVAYKTIVVGTLLYWLRGRSEPIARFGLKAITAVYAALMLWHIFNLAVILAA